MTYPRSMDGFGPEDFAIPEIKLIQSVGGDIAKKEGAVPGDFYCPVTGDVIKEGFNITVIDIRKNRTYWGRAEIEEEPPLCSSLDGKAPVSREEGSETCAQCQYRCDTPWLLSAQERRTKCLLHYNILALREEAPVLIRVGGISIQSVRELLTQLRLNRQLKGEYHRVLIHVTSQKKKTAVGEAYLMQFRTAELVQEPAKIAELLQLSQQFLGVALPPGRPEEEITPVSEVLNPMASAELASVELQIASSVQPPATKVPPKIEDTIERLMAKKEKPVEVDTDF